MRDLLSQLVAFRSGYLRNFGRGGRPGESITMPAPPQLGGSPLPVYLNLRALVPVACPVTPSHDSEPMSQPLLNCAGGASGSKGGASQEGGWESGGGGERKILTQKQAWPPPPEILRGSADAASGNAQ